MGISLSGALGDLTGGVSGIVMGADPNLAADALTGGAVSNAQAVEQTNQQNINFAQAQEGYQTQMSDTSYQRGVQDMRAAGLNPMLAYSQGGDSTPTGVSPQLQAPQPGNVGANLASTLATSAQGTADLEKTASQTALQDHQVQLVDANRVASQANASESFANVPNIAAKEENTRQQTETEKARTEIEKERARSAKAGADQDEMSRDISKKRFGFDKKMALPDAVIERGDHVTGMIGNAFGAARKGIGAAGDARDYSKRVRNNW